MLDLTVVPANEASWDDLRTVVGTGEAVGWCAVEPRSAYPRMLRNSRVRWEGGSEDRLDDSVWVVTCFVVR